MGQTIYTSATPGPFEREISEKTVQQVIRPTGILDPEISVRPVEGQIEDLLQEVAMRVKKGQRALVTVAVPGVCPRRLRLPARHLVALLPSEPDVFVEYIRRQRGHGPGLRGQFFVRFPRQSVAEVVRRPKRA